MTVCPTSITPLAQPAQWGNVERQSFIFLRYHRRLHLYYLFNVWTGSLTGIMMDAVMKSAGMAELEAALVLRADAYGLAEMSREAQRPEPG